MFKKLKISPATTYTFFLQKLSLTLALILLSRPVLANGKSCLHYFSPAKQSQTTDSQPGKNSVITNSPLEVKLKHILQAHENLKKYMPSTPLVHSESLSKEYGMQIYLKLESQTEVGAFKLRGAINRMLYLSKSERAAGVITASSGNHAQGVAYGANLLGVKAVVYMPEGAPAVKVENTRNLGAEVILHGKTFDEAKIEAQRRSTEEGKAFIHPFEDAKVIAGQGTIGLEILNELPNVDVVIGAIGGGGLMSGVSTALKSVNSNIMTIGVQSENASAMVHALNNERSSHEVPARKTLADGAAVYQASPKMLALLRGVLTETHKASEIQIKNAILKLHSLSHPTEGAGALPLAGLRQLINTSQVFKNGHEDTKVVLIVSGKNIDQDNLNSLMN